MKKAKYFLLSQFLLLGMELAWPQSPGIKFLEPSKKLMVNSAQAISIGVEKFNAPEGASVGVFVRKNVPDTELATTPGPDGPIMAYSTVLNANGGIYFVWDGVSFACLKENVLQTCRQPLLPGAYRFEVHLYDRPQVPMLMIKGQDEPPTILAKAESEMIVINQPTEEEVAAKIFWQTAIARMLKSAKVDPMAPETLKKFLHLLGGQKGPDKDGNICQSYFGSSPFEGRIIVCRNNLTKVVQVGGALFYPPPILPYEKARAAVIEFANKRYAHRVDFIAKPDPVQVKDPKILMTATYIDTSITKWSYSETGARWHFLVHQVKAGGNPKGPDRFDEDVFVEVGVDGKVCFTAVLPHEKALVTDITTAPPCH